MSEPSPTQEAFGGPGLASTQSRGNKDAITTSLGDTRVWATLVEGIVSEVFWPTVSEPQLRDLGFLVCGEGWWTEVKATRMYTVTQPAPGVLVPTVRHSHEFFTLNLVVFCHPDADAVTIQYELVPKAGSGPLQLHALIAPHLDGSGHNNSAAVREGAFVASGPSGLRHVGVVCNPVPRKLSVGFVGASDGWQDVNAHGTCTYEFSDARNGNVAMMATLEHRGNLTLGFAITDESALNVARQASAIDANLAAHKSEIRWRAFLATLNLPTFDPEDVAAKRLHSFLQQSASVLRAHMDGENPGAIVASLATPWGFAHDDPGGYHLVWPRDCVESALALAALGRVEDAATTLRYLQSHQSIDGHWPQNFSAAGAAYWTGLQLDETALPVILAVRLGELGAVSTHDPGLRSMVRAACAYLVANGPLTKQDRWEESAGASPYTVAATIAALSGAALNGWLDEDDADLALSVADWWNSQIEDLTYVTATALDDRYGVSGHYERIGAGTAGGRRGDMVVANRDGEHASIEFLVGLEYLSYARLGLRAPTDPRLMETTKVVDGELAENLGRGPLYHRYQGDGYGEGVDGAPFDGSGVGQLWPLLAGERGTYAWSLGQDPQPYVEAMLASATTLGLLPEQVWAGETIASAGLQTGRPTGSATPLVWAHGELVKLVLAAGCGYHVDTIWSVQDRYAKGHGAADTLAACIRDETVVSVPRGISVHILSTRPFVLHSGVDGWKSIVDRASVSIGLNLHRVIVPPEALVGHSSISWTRYFPVSENWENVDHAIQLC